MNCLRVPALVRSGQSGFALPEVVMSAAVLALVALSVFAGIDGAQRSTGREKSRSIAASLAEQDQERMRSMQVDKLATYDLSRNVDVDGSTYTIKSKGQWIQDSDGGTPSCVNDSKQADYIKISSTVTSQVVGKTVKAVTINSIVAPNVVYSTTHGSLAVQVKNRDGAVVKDVPVSISGPTAASGTTNDQGCAVFQYVPVGNYIINLNRFGWVDTQGNPTAVGNQDVSAGKLNVRTMVYDQAATATVAIGTFKPGLAANSSAATINANLLPSQARRVTMTNSGEVGLRRIFDASPATGAASIAADNLFPFKSKYNVYTGGCAENNPVLYDTDYFDTFTGAWGTNPGAPTAMTVRQPPLNIRVRNRDNAYVDGATVRATLEENSCAGEAEFFYTTVTRSDTGTAGWVSRSGSTYDPGLPFGDYDLCIEYRSRTSPSRWRNYRVEVQNRTALGTAGTASTLPASTGSWSGETSSEQCD